MSVDPPANEQPKVSDPGKPERRCAGAAQHDAGANGVWMPGSVAAIREQFGVVLQAHARLLTIAAGGCPDANESGPLERVRGVFPLPYLAAERTAPGAPLRAGARRRTCEAARFRADRNPRNSGLM